ncbi:MAG: radical SAM protein, partial [Zoogloeaceae bacterium]|nr:radical SAM protein [Zoogloeaceae bacterium]
MYDQGGAFCFDSLRRPLRDLRISVTDRCNLRCDYCMPGTAFGRDFVFLRHADLLSFEEVVRVARQCIALGARKIRLSGGEPLLRHEVERLVGMLAALHDDEGKPIELAMTSNGTLLTKKARALKDAGLARLNISLDALDENI